MPALLRHRREGLAEHDAPVAPDASGRSSTEGLPGAGLPQPRLPRYDTGAPCGSPAGSVLITNVGQYMGPACAEEFAKEGAVLALHERTEARAQAALDLARAYGREATVVTGRPHGLRRGRPGGARGSGAPRPARRSGQQLEPCAGRRARRRGLRRDVAVHGGSPLRRAVLLPPRGDPRDEAPGTRQGGEHHLGGGDPGAAELRRVLGRAGRTNGLTRAVGREVARHNIQVNAIAQNFVENPTYFGPEVTGQPERLARVVRNVPAGRLARSEESAKLCLPRVRRVRFLLRPGGPVRGRLDLSEPSRGQRGFRALLRHRPELSGSEGLTP